MDYSLVPVGGDMKFLQGVIIYRTDTEDKASFDVCAKREKKGDLCFLCPSKRFCAEHGEKKLYSCSRCSHLRSNITSPEFRKRRSDVATIFGFGVLKVVFDVYPHAVMRICGIADR